MNLTSIARCTAILLIGALFGFFMKTWLVQNVPENFSVSISGIHVTGKLNDLQRDDIDAISKQVRIIDKKYPLMGIKFLGPNEAEITTGIIRGPLNGSGRYFILEKKRGIWIQSGKADRRWLS